MVSINQHFWKAKIFNFIYSFKKRLVSLNNYFSILGTVNEIAIGIMEEIVSNALTLVK